MRGGFQIGVEFRRCFERMHGLAIALKAMQHCAEVVVGRREPRIVADRRAIEPLRGLEPAGMLMFKRGLEFLLPSHSGDRYQRRMAS